MATVTAPARRSTSPSSTSVLFGAAGLLFLAYPLLRPTGDSSATDVASAFASPLWLAAHLAAVAGFVCVGLALRSSARSAEVTWWIGAGLVLPYYGSEVFALNVLGQRMTGQTLLDTAEAIRLAPVAAVVFVAGLVALAVAAVSVAVREGVVALPFAIAMVGFLPQFFAPPALRVAHGVLLAVGLVLLAVHARRRGGAAAA